MAKIIKYNLCRSDENGNDNLFPVIMGWNEANEETAKREAHNGEYIIEDDGEPDPVADPTQLDRIEAQVAYTALMTDTLLEV